MFHCLLKILSLRKLYQLLSSKCLPFVRIGDVPLFTRLFCFFLRCVKSGTSPNSRVPPSPNSHPRGFFHTKRGYLAISPLVVLISQKTCTPFKMLPINLSFVLYNKMRKFRICVGCIQTYICSCKC